MFAQEYFSKSDACASEANFTGKMDKKGLFGEKVWLYSNLPKKCWYSIRFAENLKKDFKERL